MESTASEQAAFLLYHIQKLSESAGSLASSFMLIAGLVLVQTVLLAISVRRGSGSPQSVERKKEVTQD